MKTKIKNKDKGFIAQGIIAIVVIAIVGGTFYVSTLNKNKNIQNEDNTRLDNNKISLNKDSATDSSSEWKTYTSKKNDFSFQYPSNWSVCDNKSPDVEYVRVSVDCVRSQTNLADYFTVRNIGDIDLGQLQSGTMKSDTGWNTFSQNNLMRSIYYQTKNINLVLVVNDISNKDTLDNIKSTFKLISSDKLPVITSISQSSGPIGTIITLIGTNLAGFEGDLNAIIENEKGETAFLPGIGSVPVNDKIIKIKIESQLCKKDNSYSGKPCESYLNIIPGTYNIYTAPWGKISNKVKFTVTNSGITIKGWIRGKIQNLTLQEVSNSFIKNNDGIVGNDSYSGRNFTLSFNNSKCYRYSSSVSKGEISCSESDSIGIIGERVRVIGNISGNNLNVITLEDVTKLPISEW